MSGRVHPVDRFSQNRGENFQEKISYIYNKIDKIICIHK